MVGPTLNASWIATECTKQRNMAFRWRVDGSPTLTATERTMQRNNAFRWRADSGPTLNTGR